MEAQEYLARLIEKATALRQQLEAVEAEIEEVADSIEAAARDGDDG